MIKFARCPFAKTTANCFNSFCLSFDFIRESASTAFDSMHWNGSYRITRIGSWVWICTPCQVILVPSASRLSSGNAGCREALGTRMMSSKRFNPFPVLLGWLHGKILGWVGQHKGNYNFPTISQVLTKKLVLTLSSLTIDEFEIFSSSEPSGCSLSS